MAEKFDVIVVGAGPGGYVAAIRCAQLGLNTVCIDNQVNQDGKSSLGGTCLNTGCIPSKALLDSSEQYHKIAHQFPAHGINIDNATMDVAQMQARKQRIVDGLTGGISHLFKANKVTLIHGHGRIMADNTITVLDNDSQVTHTLSAREIILAPGSVPIELPDIPFDHEFIVSSTDALNFDQVPKRLGIIGSGVIGLELGSVWNRLGADVVILEALDDFLAVADRQVAREAKKQFTKQGLDIRLGATVNSATVNNETVNNETVNNETVNNETVNNETVNNERVNKTESGANGVHASYTQKGVTCHLEVDKLIVAVGRRPATDGLLSPDCGVTTDARGFIEVDNQCKTNAPNIWAIGDAVRGPMLAHKSAEEGVAIAQRIAGGYGHVDFNCVPWVIYTAPEIAWVGQTEHALKAQGIEIKTGSFPFAATGRAQAMEQPIGFVKMIADKYTDRLLGVHMVGPHVSELIGECVLAMEYQASSEDIARTIHAHPTLSEATHEAALAVNKQAIHKAN